MSANLLKDISADLSQEIFQDILTTDKLRIERIVSKGHVTEDDWYDQQQNEWVLVIQGEAKLLFEQDNRVLDMSAGSYVNIKAHCKHKVLWTDPQQETIWLAIYY